MFSLIIIIPEQTFVHNKQKGSTSVMTVEHDYLSKTEILIQYAHILNMNKIESQPYFIEYADVLSNTDVILIPFICTESL